MKFSALLQILWALPCIVSLKHLSFQRKSKSALAAVDVPLIPTLILSTAGIFAIFNIDNKIDITDKGLAEARRKKRNERIARGEDLNPKNKENLDPYRWKIFEDDTDDDNFSMLDSKKTGGGCG
jgi:hypothetical protein